MIRENMKWTNKLTEWYSFDGKRKIERQRRWTDELKTLCGPLWIRIAADKTK